ncbi:MAG: HEAT repeat domain-containing protein, partial [Deltaproteobacteria bacterium]|nr:HEAT repeat domain-containing protein [Deltaproteobacteria bacterium]
MSIQRKQQTISALFSLVALSLTIHASALFAETPNPAPPSTGLNYNYSPKYKIGKTQFWVIQKGDSYEVWKREIDAPYGAEWSSSSMDELKKKARNTYFYPDLAYSFDHRLQSDKTKGNLWEFNPDRDPYIEVYDKNWHAVTRYPISGFDKNRDTFRILMPRTAGYSSTGGDRKYFMESSQADLNPAKDPSIEMNIAELTRRRERMLPRFAEKIDGVEDAKRFFYVGDSAFNSHQEGQKHSPDERTGEALNPTSSGARIAAEHLRRTQSSEAYRLVGKLYTGQLTESEKQRIVALGKGGDNEVIEELSKVGDVTTEKVRSQAYELLGEIGRSHPSAIAALKWRAGNIAGETPLVRLAAIEALGKINSPESTAILQNIAETSIGTHNEPFGKSARIALGNKSEPSFARYGNDIDALDKNTTAALNEGFLLFRNPNTPYKQFDGSIYAIRKEGGKIYRKSGNNWETVKDANGQERLYNVAEKDGPKSGYMEDFAFEGNGDRLELKGAEGQLFRLFARAIEEEETNKDDKKQEEGQFADLLQPLLSKLERLPNSSQNGSAPDCSFEVDEPAKEE